LAGQLKTQAQSRIQKPILPGTTYVREAIGSHARLRTAPGILIFKESGMEFNSRLARVEKKYPLHKDLPLAKLLKAAIGEGIDLEGFFDEAIEAHRVK
jgi:hypothetical protein